MNRKLKKYSELREFKGYLCVKGIKYRELSKEMGISATSLSNKINGIACFDLIEVDFIAKYFDMTSDEISSCFFPGVSKSNKTA